MICVVLLQGCVGFVGGETGYCSESCVTGDGDGTGEDGDGLEEGIVIKEESIKVEEAADVKDEMPEAIVFPPITTEHEVRFWGVCGVLGGVCEVVTAVVCEVVTAVVCEVVTAVVCEVVTAVVCELVTAVVCEVVTAVVCEVLTAHAFRPFIAHTPKGNFEITVTGTCFVLCCGCHNF
jgi:hypothetical protein